MSGIEKALETYEIYERLKYNEDFIEFKKVVDHEMDRLDNIIHTTSDKEELWDTQKLHKKLKVLFDAWFDNAEKEAKQIRTQIDKRKKKKDQA